jgi:hypothetical protein
VTLDLTLIYAGIGARRTPPVVCELMVETARLLAARGWTLRTGGAEGADTAFLSGCLLWWPAPFELYLPWRGFSDQAPATLERPTQRALDIAARYHPRWEQLDDRARQLHARNVHQVLGAECDQPLRMITCWTPDGSLDGQGPDSGGTGMALRVAAGEAPGAEVINLARDEHWNRIAAFADPSGNRFARRELHRQERLL